MPDHKGHLLSRDILRRDNKIAFVLTIRRVKHYDEFAIAKGTNRILDTVELELRRGSIRWHLSETCYSLSPSLDFSFSRRERSDVV